MRKSIAAVTVLAFVAASCGSKKKAGPAAGSGSDSSATATGDGAATASTVPPDPAQVAVATAAADVAKLLVPDEKLRAERTSKLIDAVVDTTRDLGRDAWNPKAVFEAVGPNRVELFTWVRDNTALVPYRGSLRGAVGVVMDRVGNSLDRALLLADLLKQAGIEVRLVSGTLDAAALGKLVESASTRARPALPETTLDEAALVARLVKDLGIDPTAFAERTAKFTAAANALRDRTRKRIAEQSAALAKLIPAVGDPSGPDTAAFDDHWWVQAEDGGAWVDLDPSLPDAEPGQTLTVAGEPIAPDAIPIERRHTLTIRVIGEVWRDQVREEAVLLEHTMAPADHWGQRIAISNIAFDMPDHATWLAAPAPLDALRSAVTGQTEWMPVLLVGDTMVAKMSVSDAGELYDATDAHGNANRLARLVQRATKAAVGGATDLLGTLPDDPGGTPLPAKPPIAATSGFTAEWIEYEIRAPGSPSTIARRVVFDAVADRANPKPIMLSDTARLDRTLALVGETTILPMFARIPAAFVLDRKVAAFVSARPVAAELATLSDLPDATARLAETLSKLVPVPGVLYDLALARFDLGGVGDQVYLDRLDVVVERQRLVGSDFGFGHEIDIVANAVAIWPTSTDQRQPRIVQGVADTAAEAALLGCATPAGCVRGVNTSDRFAESSADWIVTRPGSPAALDHLPVAVRPLAAADLAAGYVVIAPPGGSTATWWRIRADTGEVLGMGARGGITAAEYVSVKQALVGYAAALVICAVQGARTGAIRNVGWCAWGASIALGGALAAAVSGGLFAYFMLFSGGVIGGWWAMGE